MKNLLIQFCRKSRHKLLSGFTAILFFLCLFGNSSALWITGQPYYLKPGTSTQIPMDSSYTLEFYWENPVDKQVYVIGGGSSGNPVYYYSNGTYAVEFPDEWESYDVCIGTYPRTSAMDVFYPSYHPCTFDFGSAAIINLGTDGLYAVNPGAVGKEIVERPSGPFAAIRGDLIFPQLSSKSSGVQNTIISLYRGNNLVSSFSSVDNKYNLSVKSDAEYKVMFSRPGYSTKSIIIHMPSAGDIISNVDFGFTPDMTSAVADNYVLSQNYPNPFNPVTKINFSIPKEGIVTLKIFDMSGKEVANLLNEFKTAGSYDVNFNASNLSSGIYFYSLTVNGNTITKKLTLLK